MVKRMLGPPAVSASALSKQVGAQRRRVAEVQKRVKELERELRRKDKALAETAALLVLEKNFRAWAGTRG